MPNVHAKSLKQQPTLIIGVFFNELCGPVYSALIKGMEMTAHAYGYDLVACSAHVGAASTAHKYLANGYVDGAVVIAANLNSEFLCSVADHGLPIVVLDRIIEYQNIQSIVIDNYQGGYAATEHLIRCGNDVVYYFAGPASAYDNQERFRGYCCALEDNGLAYSEKLYVSGNFTEEKGYSQFQALYRRKMLPAAIFAANDETALGIIRAALDVNLDAMDLVGFDDIDAARILKLSTVSHDKYKMGELAIEHLLQMLDKPPNTALAPVILPSKLVVRDTRRVLEK